MEELLSALRAHCLSKTGAVGNGKLLGSGAVVPPSVFLIRGMPFAVISGQRVTLRADPALAAALKNDHAFVGATPGSETGHWIVVDLSVGDLVGDFLHGMVDHSYDMVLSALQR